jgi:prevent-host-death family protein
VKTISHRELRNNSSEVLHTVSAGEIIEVTNHGKVAAVLIPPATSNYERLVAAGKIRGPRYQVDLRTVCRASLDVATLEILDEMREDR